MPTLENNVRKTYTVQEAAAKTGISVHTLRYYEKEHLIEPVEREGNGKYRRYSEENLRSIAFLRKLKKTGMPIREMQRFVALYREGDCTLQARHEMLTKHRRAVVEQIAEMQSHLSALDYKLALYETQGAERNWHTDEIEIENQEKT